MARSTAFGDRVEDSCILGRAIKLVTIVLTLEAVAEKPEIVTHSLVLSTGEVVVFRPLQRGDEVGLADFLQSLSPQTRRFSAFSHYGSWFHLSCQG